MSELEDRANDARRLGLMIVESRSGQALAAAIPHLREAADLFGREQRMVRRAECLIDLGRVHGRLGQSAAAAEVFSEALALVEDENDLTQAIIAASEAGLARMAHRDHDPALQMLRRAEVLADKANDHLQLAQVRHDLARCHIARGEASAAKAAAESALATFTAFRKSLQRTACEERLAEAAALAGDAGEAERRFKAAATSMSEMGRHADADMVLAHWSDFERDRGAFDEAVRIDRERIASHEATGNRGLQSHAMLHLGMVLAKRQDHGESLATFRRALVLCESADDRLGMAQADFHIGAALVRSGDATEGLRRLLMAVELAGESGNRKLEEEALAAVVRQQRAAGDASGAMLSLRRWAEVLRRIGDHEHEIKVLGEQVEVARQTGDWTTAEQALRDLIAACGDPAHLVQLIDAHHHLGVMIIRRGDLSTGVDHLRQALSLLGDLPAYGTRSQLLYRIGNIELRQNNAPAALKYLQAALAANPDEKLRPRILVDLGNAQAMLGQDDIAVELFEQAAKVAEKQGDMRATTIIRRGAGGLRKG
jgi:tetratricopeptide (TPR) repeat protein